MKKSNVGRRLREIRHSKSYTQAQLAQRINRIQQDIWRYETGAIRIPADLLPILAEALGVPVIAFFDELEPVA